MDVRIHGFGGRSLGGFPHRSENSFFHLAIERLRLESTCHLASSVCLWPKFSPIRAIRYLDALGTNEHPDVVVLQFAPRDLIPARGEVGGPEVVFRERAAAHAAGPLTALRWHMESLLADCFHLTAGANPAAYIKALAEMVRAVTAHGGVPVVISPFVLGSPREDRLARQCVSALAEAASRLPSARFVDAYSILDKFPRREILLCDGLHLTIQGQVLVAEGLFPLLVRLLREQQSMAAGEAA